MCAQSRQVERPLPTLFLVPNLVVGGSERQVAELLTHMDRSRFRPIVVCQKDGGPFYDQIEAAGIEIHRFDLPGRWDPRFPWRLARFIQAKGIRAMVIRGFSTGVIGRLVGRFIGLRPIIMAEHSTGRIDSDPKKPPLERLLAPLADGVIAVARGQVPYLVHEVGYEERQIRVVHNGVDLSLWPPLPRSPEILEEFSIPESAPVVGVIANLRPEKDHPTLLRAAKLVLERLPETRFLLVGWGRDREKLIEMTNQLGLNDRVHFTGKRADIAQLLSVFDVSVLSSVNVETFPMAFLEAMSMERPLISTPAGGVPEMIEEGKNGYLVPMRDPPALADAIVKVVADRETARRMGAHSRRLVEENFTIEHMVRGTEEFLDSFFDSNGA